MHATNAHLLPNAMSVDVEEYFQVSAFESVILSTQWESWPSRVEFATESLLDVFASAGVRITFFTLGWIAERHPQLLRRMVAEGHEVACHGYNHTRATTQTRDEFRADLLRSKALLEDVIVMPVYGYRAASFSIDIRICGPSPKLRRPDLLTARASIRSGTISMGRPMRRVCRFAHRAPPS